ncbi:hypothetical protein [Bacillus kexueae]|uniref:hypothetical protein n=1 Tax=Aeribacillus kexueae TaxID=2078952 RepID=UPI001FAE7A2C|nr:hypothetical protein [Bacillus kexueae]
MAIVILLLILCTYLGIRFLKKNRKIAVLFFTPLLFFIGLMGIIIYHSLYETNPESVQFSINHENNQYYISGKWVDSIDVYRHPFDLIVFYLPSSKKINISLTNQDFLPSNYDVEWLKKDVEKWMKDESMLYGEPLIYLVETKKQFEFSFILPDEVEENEVKIFYLHLREEPMDSITFWKKEINLQSQE